MRARIGLWGDYMHISQGLGLIREQHGGLYHENSLVSPGEDGEDSAFSCALVERIWTREQSRHPLSTGEPSFSAIGHVHTPVRLYYFCSSNFQACPWPEAEEQRWFSSWSLCLKPRRHRQSWRGGRCFRMKQGLNPGGKSVPYTGQNEWRQMSDRQNELCVFLRKDKNLSLCLDKGGHRGSLPKKKQKLLRHQTVPLWN